MRLLGADSNKGNALGFADYVQRTAALSRSPLPQFILPLLKNKSSWVLTQINVLSISSPQ